MSEITKGMTWSYSRINKFWMCPYSWFLNYVEHSEESPRFYSSFGLFMHGLIEKFLKKEVSKEDLPFEFILGFSTNVLGNISEKIKEKYIQRGLDYLNDIERFDFEIKGVEEKIDFVKDGYNFVAKIDLVGEKDGEFIIVDHKSTDLTKKKRGERVIDTEKSDDMFKQLYIYAEAVKSKYGKYPSELWLNSFGCKKIVKKKFSEDEFNDAWNWAIGSIKTIEEATNFFPKQERFGCKFLCDVSEDCCYVNDEV